MVSQTFVPSTSQSQWLLSFPVFACSSGAAPRCVLSSPCSFRFLSHPSIHPSVRPPWLYILPPRFPVTYAALLRFSIAQRLASCAVCLAQGGDSTRELRSVMAWNGGGFGGEEEGSGLELSLGLPGYYTRSPGRAAGVEETESGGSAAAATGKLMKGSSGFKARPAAAAPVVGWPPVRAFRRNLAASSSKPSNHAHHDAAGAKVEAGKKGRFVKINMDGVPIGRKVDLAAHGSYDRLSAAVDQLFRGLLAAQASGGEQKVITGLLNGSGEYTLVYEDDEGDQMLVGDVPWEMFIATAKRLRVLRSSDLNASSLRAASRTRPAVEL
ncbi:hypothetical protein EJB05_33140, partial [Eragrostis curvula]